MSHFKSDYKFQNARNYWQLIFFAIDIQMVCYCTCVLSVDRLLNFFPQVLFLHIFDLNNKLLSLVTHAGMKIRTLQKKYTTRVSVLC